MLIAYISKNRLMIYELVMAFLALVVVAILFVEFTRPLTEEQERILGNVDLTILIIFAIDYFYRFAKAKAKWQFVKNNIFDLIAIMPFDKAFRIARLARLVRLVRMARFTKLIRLFAFARRFGNTFAGVLRTNGLIYMIIITFSIIFFGAFGILAFEPGMENFGDALWWSLVTTTTVGYGDISPESTGGRILAGILMLVGIGFLGMVTASLATFFVNRLWNSQEKEKVSIVGKQVEYVKNALDEIEDLSNEEYEYLCETIKAIRNYKTKNNEKKNELQDISE
jgi:voltage-gated potassium channel